ncbi:hypothetical protein ETC03_09825 [Geobacillus sp. MMMUD3]|nr:hypothetical protein [Geobacillus sp. MMMUD3]
MNLLVGSWWYIYSNQGIGFMSPFLFGCKFMLANLLIYSTYKKGAWTVKLLFSPAPATLLVAE